MNKQKDKLERLHMFRELRKLFSSDDENSDEFNKVSESCLKEDIISVMSITIKVRDVVESKPAYLPIFAYVDVDSRTSTNAYFISDIGRTHQMINDMYENQHIPTNKLKDIYRKVLNNLSSYQFTEPHNQGTFKISSEYTLPTIIETPFINGKSELSYRVSFKEIKDLKRYVQIIGTCQMLTKKLVHDAQR